MVDRIVEVARDEKSLAAFVLGERARGICALVDTGEPGIEPEQQQDRHDNNRERQ
jgi:hypothetical protein